MMVAGVIQIFIGITGLLGMLLKQIGPISVAVSIIMASEALFDDFAEMYTVVVKLTRIIFTICC